MKTHPVEAVIHVKRETVTHETAKRHFSQPNNHAWKKEIYLLTLSSEGLQTPPPWHKNHLQFGRYIVKRHRNPMPPSKNGGSEFLQNMGTHLQNLHITLGNNHPNTVIPRLTKIIRSVITFVCWNTHTDRKDKLLEWPDRSCLLLYVSECIH